jgi:hypothetical protein
MTDEEGRKEGRKEEKEFWVEHLITFCSNFNNRMFRVGNRSKNFLHSKKRKTKNFFTNLYNYLFNFSTVL